MAKQISLIQYKRYKMQMDEVKKKIVECGEAVKAARALGDLSENAELDSAKAEMSRLQAESSKLDDLLHSEVIEYDNGPTLTVGSLVEISSDEMNPMIVLLSDAGNLDIDHVLNTDSELGRKVKGNSSGVYEVQGVKYHVKKLPESKTEEFLLSIPTDKTILSKLLEGISDEN